MNWKDTLVSKSRVVEGLCSLWVRRATVPLVLAAWRIPDRVLQTAARLRTGVPTAKTAAYIALTAAIVVPSTLYWTERARRIEIQTAYRQTSVSDAAEVETLQGTLQGLLEEQSELRSLLIDAGYAVFDNDGVAVQLLATGYSSSVIETDNTPFITASNTRTRHGIVAMSRDLLKRYNPDAPFDFGDTVHISGLGDFEVEDSMHWRWRRRIDIWHSSRAAAKRFGARRVTVSKPLPRTGTDDTAAANGMGGVLYASSTALAQ
jgi:3D (Asp-Asp-Asp) domain-containing protein